MKATLKHVGYNPITEKHTYYVFCENGHVDVCLESQLITATEIELDEKLWTPGVSGWADLECPQCGWKFHERVVAGSLERCPECAGMIDTNEVVLEDSNLADD